MKRTASCLLPVCLLAVLAGCGGDDSQPPADVHGSYTITATNGPSSCPLPNWTQGSVTSGVPVTITQNGNSVSADVGGAGAVFLGIYCGSTRLEGTVSGPSLDMRLAGRNSFSSGSCAFTVDAHLTATITGDALSGEITYGPNTNASTDCAAIQTCSARMNLNGTRPPPAQ